MSTTAEIIDLTYRLDKSEEWKLYIIPQELAVSVEYRKHKPFQDRSLRHNMISEMKEEDMNWLLQYLRERSSMLIPQIAEVMLIARFDFNDVKRELVKL